MAGNSNMELTALKLLREQNSESICVLLVKFKAALNNLKGKSRPYLKPYDKKVSHRCYMHFQDSKQNHEKR